MLKSHRPKLMGVACLDLFIWIFPVATLLVGIFLHSIVSFCSMLESGPIKKRYYIIQPYFGGKIPVPQN